jgi:molybdenum cofactor synthesis domain-containing protein
MAGLRVGILTVSDRVANGQMADRGGPTVAKSLPDEWTVTQTTVVPDEQSEIEATLEAWCESGEVDVIFTTGGTGLSPRDVTPEATTRVCDRMVPGMAEAMRAKGLSQTAGAMLSRAVAGVRGEVVIINLPGSPRGAAEGVQVVSPVLEHALTTLRGSSHAPGSHPPPEA